MNKKTLVSLILIIIALLVSFYYIYQSKVIDNVVPNTPNKPSITYKNDDYGFNFSLPATWEGYSIVNATWVGSPLNSTTTQNGTKLLIRNPKWTAKVPYEDLPILIFTISQWDSYIKEGFSVSAAPILATELARNNKYVFALPPRWNFDYSEGYVEATAIIAGSPLHAFNK